MSPNNFEGLNQVILQTNAVLLTKVQKQVNVAMTLRNWLVGAHIVEYEQKGQDRSKYGSNLLQKLSLQLKNDQVKGMSVTNLKLFRQFYLTYPQIGQALPDYLQSAEIQQVIIGLALPDHSTQDAGENHSRGILNYLSFYHFLELIKLNTEHERRFYEAQVIKNNWSSRELKRATDSLLYQRTGGFIPDPIIPKHQLSTARPDEVFKDPYMLEFLQLQDKSAYSEADLEMAIIDHLQEFLLELGSGFCFEARQKRITFSGTHYRIDLVFYHKILKASILIDLKLGEFSHADAGQMNVYLNYYRENETVEGDNPPIGIILCAGKDENLVRYATAGLAHKVFVSQYLVNLPKVEELQKVIAESRKKGLQ